MKLKSGWIINYKDGERVIMSEGSYKEYESTVDIELVKSEEHWFNLELAIELNPNLKIYE